MVGVLWEGVGIRDFAILDGTEVFPTRNGIVLTDGSPVRRRTTLTLTRRQRDVRTQDVPDVPPPRCVRVVGLDF